MKNPNHITEIGIILTYSFFYHISNATHLSLWHFQLMIQNTTGP